MKHAFKVLFAVLNCAMIFSISVSTSFSQVTDKDGNTYKTVTIGTQEWMAENLNVSTFRNGDTIPEANTDAAWEKAGNEQKPAWCYYDNDPTNGKKYGKLYNWYAVNDKRGLAPKGWHIPSDAEWTILTDYLGGKGVAGGKLKAITLWDIPNTGATNESGFTALPGGSRVNYGLFGIVGSKGFWWCSTEYDDFSAWFRYLFNSYGGVDRYSGLKSYGHSVRCVKD